MSPLLASWKTATEKEQELLACLLVKTDKLKIPFKWTWIDIQEKQVRTHWKTITNVNAITIKVNETAKLALTGGSWQLRGLLCLEATKLLIRPKPWLCPIKQRYKPSHTMDKLNSQWKVQQVIVLVISSHHPSSPHWTTRWHWEPGQFSSLPWILESHLIKATETVWIKV